MLTKGIEAYSTVSCLHRAHQNADCVEVGRVPVWANIISKHSRTEHGANNQDDESQPNGPAAPPLEPARRMTAPAKLASRMCTPRLCSFFLLLLQLRCSENFQCSALLREHSSLKTFCQPSLTHLVLLGHGVQLVLQRMIVCNPRRRCSD